LSLLAIDVSCEIGCRSITCSVLDRACGPHGQAGEKHNRAGYPAHSPRSPRCDESLGSRHVFWRVAASRYMQDKTA
jgi:hypothetical protein